MLLDDIIHDSRWDMTYLGMQIMVEGLALAAFGFMHQMTTEPLLKQLLRYVMSDEARHVAFGVLSLQGVLRGARPTPRSASARSSRSRPRCACATASSSRRCGSAWASTSRRPIELVMQTPTAPDVPDDAVLEDRPELQEARPARRATTAGCATASTSSA